MYVLYLQCKILSGFSVDCLVLISYNYQYCGFFRGIKFLQDKIVLVDGVDFKGLCLMGWILKVYMFIFVVYKKIQGDRLWSYQLY